jgi:uncharacterized protein (DUF58 family)
MASVRRFGGAVAGSAALATAGVASGQQPLLAAAVVPLAFVVVGALSGTPAAAGSVRVDRRIAPSSPMPGDTVMVTLTVENATDRALPDVRVVDGVPDAVTVFEGSPRAAVALRPGESATVTYSLVARRGEYAFDPPRVRLRNAIATRYDTAAVEPAGDAGLSCEVGVDEVPLHEQTTGFTGQLPTDTGGEGVEFYGTREYRNGDPPGRIDWRQLAKSGSLTTVDYRRQQAARTVVVVDARDACDLAPAEGYPTGVDLGTYAAARVVGALAAADHQVGVAAVEDGYPDETVAWVEPSSGPEVRARAERLFAGVLESPTGGRGVADGSGVAGDTDAVTDLRRRLSPSTQLFVVSPFLDGYPVEAVRTLSVHGHAVSVVSPDATGHGSTGKRIAALERRTRLGAVRDAGVPVVDWHPDEPLTLALADALEGMR